jgi:salicylate biosynthesis isochorismate synthase/menaquinone-specific isochorismate synthase
VPGFGESAYVRLADRLERARLLAHARGRPVVASITVALAPETDPIAHARHAASAVPCWSIFSQPAREETVLVGLGASVRVQTNGPERFDQLIARCSGALDGALFDDPFEDVAAPRGSGIVWVGGFAFFDAEQYADAWRDFPSTSLVLPRAVLTRRGGADPQARLTLNANVEQDGSDLGEMLSDAEQLIESLQLDATLEAPGFASREGRADVSSTSSPQHYEHAVEQAASEIRSGGFEKLVLAREVTLRREQSIDPFNVLAGLVERFPECTVFAVSEAETTFVGASPELLIRREGRRASTLALAGSARRSSEPETDAHLGAGLLTSVKNRTEHEIVVRRIERTLGRFSAWVSTGREPELAKVSNIQHLATPIRAQLTEPRPVLELAGALHPTPAVGGEPWPLVGKRIRELEGFDRGWYTGGVGWSDLFEDGEFHVALRSALIDGAQARLFAGCGIVGSSEPADELAETETKLAALLPVLSAS